MDINKNIVSTRKINKKNKRFYTQGVVVGTIDGNYNIEETEVLVDKYSINGINETEIKRLVNLGTYFSGVTGYALYIEPSDFNTFVNTYNYTNSQKLLWDHSDIQLLKQSSVLCEFPLGLYCLSKVCPFNNKRIIQKFEHFRSNTAKDSKTGNVRIIFHPELDDIYGKELPGVFKEHNMKIIRLLQEGNSNSQLICKRSKAIVENIESKMRGKEAVLTAPFQLHHILVINGKSINKISEDPSKVIRGCKIDENKDLLIDIMGTICLSEQEHKTVHTWRNSDISNYYEHELPWCLRNFDNFNTICNMFNLNLDYHDFIFKQSAQSYTNKEYSVVYENS